MADYEYIVGRIGTKPEAKSTSAGELADFRVAVDGAFDKVAMKRVTNWYDATAWSPMDDVVTKNFTVGSLVYIGGPTSVYKGTTGDRLKINVKEIGSVTRFTPVRAATPKPVAAGAMPGIEDDDDF